MAEPSIERIVGRRVWDSRGRPTVEAEIFLDTGASGRAIAPAGASTGTHEAVELRDGGLAFGGFGVDRAVANINGAIAAALHAMPIADQAAIDRRLIELDGTSNKVRTVVAGDRRKRASEPADADDPDLWRRRPCGPACRHPGFPHCPHRRCIV